MKVSCINVNTNILLGKEQDNIINFLSKKFLENGILISRVTTIPISPEMIKNVLQTSPDKYVFIIGDCQTQRNYQIKNILSRFFAVSFVQNQSAINHISNYYKKLNLPFQLESEGEYYLPNGAELLKTNMSVQQGFYYLGDKAYVFLPSNLRAVEEIFHSQLLPLMIKDVRVVYQTMYIKTFGISEKDILVSLQDLIKNNYKIFITTYPDNLDVAIMLRYNKNIDKSIFQAFVTNIYNKLKKYIYSNENISLYEMAYDLLKISNKKISIAETVTAGYLTSQFLACTNNTNSHLVKSIVCNNVDSISKTFDVNKTLINQHNFVSVEVAYEISVGMLEKSGADLVVSTCGEWVSTASKASQMICFFAVGDSDGIHVYKNTYSGSYETVIDNISKSAMFYLIKKIKQNDLFFSKTIV